MSLSVSINLQYQQSDLSEAFTATQTAAVSTAGYNVQVLTLGTAHTQVSTATMNQLGYAYCRSLAANTGATCTITFGRLQGTALVDMLTLRPREIATFRLAPGDYAAKAAEEGYRFFIASFEG